MENGLPNPILPSVKVKSSSSIHTSYDGAQLKSKQRIYFGRKCTANTRFIECIFETFFLYAPP